MPDTDPSIATWRDRLEAIDALNRFGAGVDHGDGELLASAFDEQAVVDFGPCGRKLGLSFPVLTGGGPVAGFLAATSRTQITTHVIANGRATIAGDTARLRALVDATHIPRSDRSRRCRMMNWYDAELSRHAMSWRIRRLLIDNAWFTGDPQVLIGR